MKKSNKNKNSSCSLYFDFLFKGFLYVLPLVLFFSYRPVISLGSSESMNFELSLPLIWLVLFDLLALVMMVIRKRLLRGLRGKWWIWILLPVWLTVSLIWSLNVTRGVLTVGILWLILFAGYGMWSFRELFDVEFRSMWWKWFMGSTLVVCTWCIVQCILDLAGVGKEYTLMCAGCTYRMFGFPHPNGFAIEPQFMGNLLLAPLFLTGWRMFRLRSHADATCFFVIAVTLFLTFSRGAIYASIVGLVFMTVAVLVASWRRRARKSEKLVVKQGDCKRGIVKRVGLVWVTVVMAFGVTLVAQGVMAEVGPMDDTFSTGVAKVLNHLSLGIIDIKGNDTLVENPVENFEENRDEIENGNDGEKAVFDGYVAESTDTRVKLNNAALTVWSGDVKTMLLGVGLGGAGQALYNAGLSSTPKEIVQNQYVSLLLETGIVGILLLVITLCVAIKAMLRAPSGLMLLSLMVAYGISLLFFAGLPNALHIYLLPILLYAMSVGLDSSKKVKLTR